MGKGNLISQGASLRVLEPGDLIRSPMQRMAILIREFLGERHPLADRASANTVAA